MNAATATALRFQDDDDLSDAPEEELVNLECVRGVEMMSPRPARKHTGASSRLHVRLGYHFDSQSGGPTEPRGWMIIHEPELRLEGGPKVTHGVAPDLAGWRDLRAPEENDEAAYITAPDWICETLSPRTRRWDRETKMPFYAYHRVGHLWLMDPVERELEVYALGRRGWEHLGTFGNQVVRAEPFDAVELDLSTIWPLTRR